MSITAADPLVGRLLDGRYRVDARIARGGMATVYEALDTRLERTVALKVMHPGLAEDHEFVTRFIREAKSTAGLSHPNVVAVYDQGTDDGTVFLAMEYVSGRTLRQVLREHGHLTVRQAFEVMSSVLAALGAAHRAGIIHRDVKPENVLLADDGRVKVADFGLARAVSTSTSTTGVLMGTVAYLAPEQVERGIADPRSDVYAAGTMLFELITGSKPFDGEHPIQVAYQHVHNDVPAPSTRLPGLAGPVDALVRHATRRDPDHRPADANAFLDELTNAFVALTNDELDARLTPVTAGEGADAHTAVVNRHENTAVVPVASPPAPAAAQKQPPTGPYDPDSPFAGRRRRGPFALAFVLILALLVGVGAWWLGAGRYVETPSLLNKAQAAALATAKEQGLAVTFTEGYSETVPRGLVMSTDPKPGDRIVRGGTISAMLSRGPERYEVPRLTGMTLNEASDKLRETKLALGEVTQAYHTTIDEGEVIRTSPGTGKLVKPGTVIDVVISKGAEPLPVPNVIGRLLEEAKKRLGDAGFRTGVTEEYSTEVPKGRVLSQDPNSGTAPRGSEIKLVVSKGPEMIRVPRVIGMKASTARRILEQACFRVAIVSVPGGDKRVLAQFPGGGSMAPKGSTVRLSVF